MSAVTKFPGACPHCRRSTADNFAAKHPAGRHCHRDNAQDWVEKCLVVVCACGKTYTNYRHHYDRSET